MVKNVLFGAETVWMKNHVTTLMERVFPDALQDGRENGVIKVSFLISEIMNFEADAVKNVT